jgi:hypothetical protein
VHVFRRGDQVADLFQEGLVSLHVFDRAGVGLVPGVQLFLQLVALLEQGRVLGAEVTGDGVKARPELGAVHARAGQHFLFDETVQLGRNLQAVDAGVVVGGLGHGGPPVGDGGRQKREQGAVRPFFKNGLYLILDNLLNNK